MRNFSFPTKKEELKNFIISNFNREEFSVIDMDEAFTNSHISFKLRPGLERSIIYCSIVARNEDGNFRRWVASFYKRHRENTSVMMIIWAHFYGFTSDELYDILRSI